MAQTAVAALVMVVVEGIDLEKVQMVGKETMRRMSEWPGHSSVRPVADESYGKWTMGT